MCNKKNKLVAAPKNIMSDEAQYLHERVRQQIGGPPISAAQGSQIGPAQGPGCDPALFTQVQGAVDCACAEGTEGTLCDAIAAGQIMQQQPWSCMTELVDQFMNCGEDISEEKRKAAWTAFTNATGFKGIDYAKIGNELADQQALVINLNAFYLWVPLFIVILVLVWLMVGFGWFSWALGLFLTVLAFGILYSFNIAYRIHADRIMENRKKAFSTFAHDAQSQFENSVAYWPQGMFSVACAVTCDGDDCWSCNEVKSCPPCPPGVGFSRARGKMAYEEPEPETVEEKAPPAPVRKRRQQSCRGCAK